jgi:hypothetical protein
MQLSLENNEIMSKMILHYVTPKQQHTLIGRINVVNWGHA